MKILSETITPKQLMSQDLQNLKRILRFLKGLDGTLNLILIKHLVFSNCWKWSSSPFLSIWLSGRVRNKYKHTSFFIKTIDKSKQFTRSAIVTFGNSRILNTKAKIIVGMCKHINIRISYQLALYIIAKCKIIMILKHFARFQIAKTRRSRTQDF